MQHLHHPLPLFQSLLNEIMGVGNACMVAACGVWIFMGLAKKNTSVPVLSCASFEWFEFCEQIEQIEHLS